jgi:hypothetical protein
MQVNTMLTIEELLKYTTEREEEGINAFIINLPSDKADEYIEYMKTRNWIECPYVSKSENGHHVHFVKLEKNIIGFHGPAFSGKDTAASAIKKTYPDTEVFAFAGPLKEACKILFNFSDAQLYDPILKEQIDKRWGKSPRQILQWLGTDILRNMINEDFFIMNMRQRIEDSEADNIVISDVRFDNEAEFIRSLEGKVVKIERNGAKTTEHSGHITEKGISPNLINAIVKNDTSIEEFQNRIQLVAKLISKNLESDSESEPNHSNHFTIDGE